MRPEIKQALKRAIADRRELQLQDQILRAKMEAAGANMSVYEDRIAPIFQEAQDEILDLIISALEAEAGITHDPETSATKKKYLS